MMYFFNMLHSHFGMVVLFAVLAIPVVITLVFMFISHLDSTETPWGARATLECPHCKHETVAQGKTCRFCGRELQ